MQHLAALRHIDLRDLARQPALEDGETLVTWRQGSADDEMHPEVLDDLGRAELVQRVVGDRSVPGGKSAQDGRAARPAGEPGQQADRLLLQQGVEHGLKIGTHAAVDAEHLVESVAHCASGAQTAVVEPSSRTAFAAGLAVGRVLVPAGPAEAVAVRCTGMDPHDSSAHGARPRRGTAPGAHRVSIRGPVADDVFTPADDTHLALASLPLARLTQGRVGGSVKAGALLAAVRADGSRKLVAAFAQQPVAVPGLDVPTLPAPRTHLVGDGVVVAAGVAQGAAVVRATHRRTCPSAAVAWLRVQGPAAVVAAADPVTNVGEGDASATLRARRDHQVLGAALSEGFDQGQGLRGAVRPLAGQQVGNVLQGPQKLPLSGTYRFDAADGIGDGLVGHGRAHLLDQSAHQLHRIGAAVRWVEPASRATLAVASPYFGPAADGARVGIAPSAVGASPADPSVAVRSLALQTPGLAAHSAQ